ncbi:hypothetical protein F0U61_20270 [Archangium violaceum]|nr:hypothetical protein F0U61_20270 [Archangium violaceum]
MAAPAPRPGAPAASAGSDAILLTLFPRHVVTLRVPPDKLRAVNLAIERSAWGAFHTEFYPTHDFIPVWKETRAKVLDTQPSP